MGNYKKSVVPGTTEVYFVSTGIFPNATDQQCFKTKEEADNFKQSLKPARSTAYRAQIIKLGSNWYKVGATPVKVKVP